jgi:hypothetical protein
MNLLSVAPRNEITYRGYFRSPLFQVWGTGAKLLEALYAAFTPLGVTLSNIASEETAKSPADRAIVVQAGNNCIYNWRMERVELTLRNFTNEDLRALPRLMEANDRWINAMGVEPKYASYQFSYAGHAQIDGATSGQVLARVPHIELGTGLAAVPPGQILHWVDQAGWQGSLVIDHSQSVAEGLFLLYSGRTSTPGSGYLGVLDHLQRGLGELLARFDVRLENQ